MTIEIVDFPIDSMVIFYSFLYVYQKMVIFPLKTVCSPELCDHFSLDHPSGFMVQRSPELFRSPVLVE